MSANPEKHCCANRNKAQHEHDDPRIAKESVAQRSVIPAGVHESRVA